MPTKKLGEILRKNSFCLSVYGLVFNFTGSLVLIFGAIPSDDQISKMSGTYFGSNKYLSQGLVENRNLARIGLAFLLFGFLLGLLGTIGNKKRKEN